MLPNPASKACYPGNSSKAPIFTRPFSSMLCKRRLAVSGVRVRGILLSVLRVQCDTVLLLGDRGSCCGSFPAALPLETLRGTQRSLFSFVNKVSLYSVRSDHWQLRDTSYYNCNGVTVCRDPKKTKSPVTFSSRKVLVRFAGKRKHPQDLARQGE